MRLPSLLFLFNNAKKTFFRFPLMILCSFISVGIGIYLIENRELVKNFFPFINAILTSALGIPVYFSAALLASKRKLHKTKKILLMVVSTIILVVIYFTLPNQDSTHNTSLPYIKYGIYNVIAHLLVSVIPFLSKGELNGFWHFNKILFIRIWTSILYSGFLFSGLSLALTSLQLLFDLKLHEELYFELYIFIAGIFNTWFFANGIPDDLDQLNNMNEYPKGLKIFAQYILLPLLGLYLLILYVYGAKILYLWNWPKGIVSYLIICISILGILTFLLLYPFGLLKENNWIKKAGKQYYLLLFPLLVILFIAIFMRIDDYGITIKRYVVLTLGVWLAIVCIYTSLGKPNIKFVPISLSITLMLTSFGPWGMFSVSEHYQVKRLQNILEKSNILKNGKINNETLWIKDTLANFNSTIENQNDYLLNDSLHNEVKSILDYMDNYHGFAKIRHWFTQDVNKLIEDKTTKKKQRIRIDEASVYMRSMGLKYEFLDDDINNKTFSYQSKENEDFTFVAGYDYLYNFNIWTQNNNEKYEIGQLKIDSTDFLFEFKNNPLPHLLLTHNKDSIQFGLMELFRNLEKEFGTGENNSISGEKLKLIASDLNYEAIINIHSLSLSRADKKLNLTQLKGNLLIRKKK